MRRLVALDPARYESLMQAKPQTKNQTVGEKVVSNLDMEMEKILKSDLPDHDKVKRYNQALNKLKLYKAKNKPIEKPVKKARKTNNSDFKKLIRALSSVKKPRSNIKTALVDALQWKTI